METSFKILAYVSAACASASGALMLREMVDAERYEAVMIVAEEIGTERIREGVARDAMQEHRDDSVTYAKAGLGFIALAGVSYATGEKAKRYGRGERT